LTLVLTELVEALLVLLVLLLVQMELLELLVLAVVVVVVVVEYKSAFVDVLYSDVASFETLKSKDKLVVMGNQAKLELKQELAEPLYILCLKQAVV
jgi:hypothetical protein